MHLPERKTQFESSGCKRFATPQRIASPTVLLERLLCRCRKFFAAGRNSKTIWPRHCSFLRLSDAGGVAHKSM